MAKRKSRTADAPEPTPQQRLASAIKSSRDIMRKDAGLSGETDRIPQFAWLLFLKAFDDLEQRREVTERDFRPAIEPPYRWRDWAADPVEGRTGEDLLEFVNGDLIPYLRGLRGTGEHDPRDVLAGVFKETHNRMLSGYLLRDVIDVVNRVNFASADDIHTMAALYESMLREMRDAAGDSGEFYTPRPVIRFIVQQVGPQVGEVILDPACGTGGFLVEALEHLRPQVKTVQQWQAVQRNLRGIEKKPMPYLLGMMNLLLHQIEQPNIERGNALATPLSQIGRSARVDVVLTNPPFGGEEEKAIQANFPEGTRTTETALLFLQVIQRRLKPGGRCGMIVPDGVLAADGAGARTRERLLAECNLHTIVRLPPGVFAPYTDIPTNLIFFEKTGRTKEIWFYEIKPSEEKKKYSKTRPIRFEEFEECQAWWESRSEGTSAWRVGVGELDESYNLDLRNPLLLPERTWTSPLAVSSELQNKASDIVARLQKTSQDVELDELVALGEREWPHLAMSELVEQCFDPHSVEPDQTYRLLGVRLEGAGPFVREVKVGLEIGAKSLNRVRSGDFVYSRLFAWRGAFGVVSQELDGAFVSGEFPTFTVDPSSVLVDYLRVYFARERVWAEVERFSRGTTKASRNRFREPQFLAMQVPVPPLDVQERLVRHFDHLRAIEGEVGQFEESLPSLRKSLLASFFRGKL